MKILIFGKGYLGQSYFESEILGETFLSNADITNTQEIAQEFQGHSPDIIINCAGKTNLEWCKDNSLETILSNVVGPLNLLRLCEEKSIYLVHIGSGCIFEGTGRDNLGFAEDDMPNPQCFYSYTKAVCDELLLKDKYPKLLILRLRQPFSGKPHNRNLITKVINYDQLLTSQNSMTYVPDLILATKFLIENQREGVYHVCNSGTLSPYEMSLQVKSFLSLNKEFTPLLKQELDDINKKNGREKRVDTKISINKLIATGFKMASVQQRLSEALTHYQEFVLNNQS